MSVIDISVPLHPEMVFFEGDPPLSLERWSSIAEGAVANNSRLEMGVHTGTHLDAPIHFIDGAPASEAFELDALIGPAQVVDATGTDEHLDAAFLSALRIPERTTRLLLKTGNSELWATGHFETDFVAVTADGAEWLRDRGVRLVGIDYLSIAPYGDPVPTHQILLGAGVAILEGIDLRNVAPGSYELLCLPVHLIGSDGAPARAVLRTAR